MHLTTMDNHVILEEPEDLQASTTIFIAASHDEAVEFATTYSEDTGIPLDKLTIQY